MSIMIMDLTGFPLSYPVYALDENNNPSCLGIIGEINQVLPFCYQRGITKLYIQGARPYAEGIAEQLKEQYIANYSNDHYEIEIEVN